MRLLQESDYQAVLQFFARQAVEHFNRYRTITPDCTLVWLHSDAAEVVEVHQFPTSEIVQLMASEAGKHKLASAIRQLLTSTDSALRAPHAVVQVLLSRMANGEALQLLVHTADACLAIAVPVPSNGPLAVPSAFDLSSVRFDVEA